MKLYILVPPYYVKPFLPQISGVSTVATSSNEPDYEHLHASGTRIEVVVGTRSRTSLIRSTWPSLNPSLYGGAPPVSTRITLRLQRGPNFLRSVCPYPGCQRSSFSGSCPMVTISAGYWLILCSFADNPVSIPAPYGGRFPDMLTFLPLPLGSRSSCS